MSELVLEPARPPAAVERAKTTLTPRPRMLQRTCACGGTPGPDGECAACRAKRLSRQATAGAPGGGSAVSSGRVGTALASGGAPLGAATRSFMEQHFGQDFSHVRAHAGPAASAAAASLHARAFTVGGDIVFGARQYAPDTHAGRRLIAHELAHVVQQRGAPHAPQAQLEVSTPGDAGEREAEAAADAVMKGAAAPRLSHAPMRVQRTCGTALGAPSPACTSSSAPVIGRQFLFMVNCDDLQAGEAARVTSFASGLRARSELRVHGYASEEGGGTFNHELSCHRANVIAAMLRTARPDCTVIEVLEHGAQTLPPSRPFWRSVIVETLPPPRICGPDATDWLVLQVAAAKRNPTVLAIQARLAGAHRVAASYGFSAERVLEGGVAKRVLAEEARVGSPPRTGAAPAQIAASAPGQAEFGRALLAATVPLVGAPEAIVLAGIRGASLAWKGLVGTGMLYDFKNDARTMRGPKSAHCPADCANTITMCAGTGTICVNTDVPGNLVYAHLGVWVGFTELALQLGSQFAQLESTTSWDPPEDTAMIHAGAGLPDPLTRADVCSVMASLRGSVTVHTCRSCSEPTTATIV